MGIEITERCKVLRVIACEISRIISHLVWLGTTGDRHRGDHAVPLDVPGAREGLQPPGGLDGRATDHEPHAGRRMMADIPDGFEDGLCATCREPARGARRSGPAPDPQRDLGAAGRRASALMTAEEAINYVDCPVPMLRASGVAYDVRKDRPYLDYETYDFEVPVGEHGDVYDRYLVRLEEMRQSVRILEQALDRLPDGPHQRGGPAGHPAAQARGDERHGVDDLTTSSR